MSMQMSTPPDHQPRSPTLSLPPPPHHHQQAMKKRKLGSRESLGGFGSGEMDMKMAMGMAVDLGLTGEEEGEEMMTMTDEQMVRAGVAAMVALLTCSSSPLPSTGTSRTCLWRRSCTTCRTRPRRHRPSRRSTSTRKTSPLAATTSSPPVG